MPTDKIAHGTERNVYLDIIKGIAIISVVFGHCIQCGSGMEFLQSRSFFHDAVFKAIYGCHMALFMLVSGYLFGMSLRRNNWNQVFGNRFKLLLLPLMSWGLIGVFTIVTHYHGVFALIKSIVGHYLNSMWFIWAIFYNSLFVLLVRRFCKDRLSVYFIAYLLLFVTPDMFSFSLYKYMYPFFVCGYVICRFNLLIKTKEVLFSKLVLSVVCMVSYVLLMQFFSYESYIYTSGYSVVNFKIGEVELWKLWNDIFRMVTAFVGSIFVFLFVYGIWKRTEELFVWRIIANLGKASLVVYLFSGEVIFSHILPKVTWDFEHSYFVNFLETIIILIICYLIYSVMKNVRILTKVFLGGR